MFTFAILTTPLVVLVVSALRFLARQRERLQQTRPFHERDTLPDFDTEDTLPSFKPDFLDSIRQKIVNR
jgi:hypothetical protein